MAALTINSLAAQYPTETVLLIAFLVIVVIPLGYVALSSISNPPTRTEPTMDEGDSPGRSSKPTKRPPPSTQFFLKSDQPHVIRATEFEADVAGDLRHELLWRGPDEFILMQNAILDRGEGRTNQIDILYISRQGVFVIECKNWFGQLKILNGNWYAKDDEPRKSPLSQARNQANHIRHLLPEYAKRHVKALVCVPSLEYLYQDRTPETKQQARFVYSPNSLGGALRGQPLQLTDSQLADIVERLTGVIHPASPHLIAKHERHLEDLGFEV